eukprot:scaffold143101_cov27-Tisochrysis_lutea.AAC.1
MLAMLYSATGRVCKPTQSVYAVHREVPMQSSVTAHMHAGYAQQCQVRCAQDVQGKRLRLPPVPMTHPDFRQFVDFTRVMYLRLKQHEEIIKCVRGPKTWRNYQACYTLAPQSALRSIYQVRSCASSSTKDPQEYHAPAPEQRERITKRKTTLHAIVHGFSKKRAHRRACWDFMTSHLLN